MDIKCGTCAEPWDMDELHELVAGGDFLTFDDAYADFRRRGCATFGTRHGDMVADPAIGELADMLGGDVDGFATLLEDFGL